MHLKIYHRTGPGRTSRYITPFNQSFWCDHISILPAMQSDIDKLSFWKMILTTTIVDETAGFWLVFIDARITHRMAIGAVETHVFSGSLAMGTCFSPDRAIVNHQF